MGKMIKFVIGILPQLKFLKIKNKGKLMSIRKNI